MELLLIKLAIVVLIATVIIITGFFILSNVAVSDDTPGFLAVVLMVIIAVALSILTCSRSDTRESPALPTDRDILREMELLYGGAMNVDPSGFIEVNHCDSLLFTALANLTADLSAAEPDPGRYVRRPVGYPDCFATGSSRSDVSRDMLLGVTYHSYITGDLDRLLRLWDYGTSHNWIMSVHGGQHAIYGPADMALLAQTIYVLSDGERDYSIRHAAPSVAYNKEGYVRHLQAITVWLRREVYGGLLKSEIELIERYADEAPNNALFPMVLGRYDVAARLLINTYPRDRLPTSADWCDAWRIQRLDGDSGQLPCADRGLIHSGGELLFIARHVK